MDQPHQSHQSAPQRLMSGQPRRLGHAGRSGLRALRDPAAPLILAIQWAQTPRLHLWVRLRPLDLQDPWARLLPMASLAGLLGLRVQEGHSGQSLEGRLPPLDPRTR